MKGIHTADLHIGIDTIGPVDEKTGLNARVLDYIDTLDAIIEYAEEHKPNIFLIVGDTFHKRNPETTYVRLFTERLMRLSKVCQIVIIPGNHDIPGGGKDGIIDLYDTIQLPGVIIATEPSILDIDTESGPVQIACMPYPWKQNYLAHNELYKRDWRGIWKERVSDTIKQLLAELDDNIPAIFMGHFGVNSAQYGAERLFFAGDGAEVDIEDLISPKLDYVALGHLHLQQNIGTDDLPIIYPGSIERVDFSEETYPKGFAWFEISDGVDYHFVDVDARPYKTIRVDTRGKRGPTNFVLRAIECAEIEGAVVRVIVDVDDKVLLRTQDIDDALSISFSHSLAIRHDTVNSDTRLDGASVSSFTEMELLNAYFSGVSIKPSKELLSMAIDIMEDCNVL